VNTLVFDIETVPDTELGRRLYDLKDLSDEHVAQIMFTKRRQETGSEFLSHEQQRIVAISVVMRSRESLKVWSLGDAGSSEKHLIERFYDGLDKYSPDLVSWNGAGFDLPVLHYRSLLHGVTAARYWETGEPQDKAGAYAIQGLGAGGVQPIANTIVGDIYTPVERARVQGMLSGVFGVSAVIGPSLGAFIVQYGDWPIVFWMNLPIGAAAIGMIALFLPEHVQSRSHHVDYRGSVLLLLAIGMLMLLLQGSGLSGVMLAAAATIFVLAAGVLVLHERRVAEPMLPLELWRNRVIVSSSVGSLVTGTLMMGVTAYLPTYVQGNMGRGANVSAVIPVPTTPTFPLDHATSA